MRQSKAASTAIQRCLMGEIKSTLDLVMEKTRHLTLNDEEKAEQSKQEVRKRINGLRQKFNDNLLKIAGVKRELELLGKNYDLNPISILASMLVDGLKLGRNNLSDLELLKEICGVDVSALEALLLEFQSQMNFAAQQRIKNIKTDLAKKHRISGSAIVPNLERDDPWLSRVQEIMEQYDRALIRTKTNLTGDA